MKKLISSLITLSFILGLSFSSLFAQEQTTSTATKTPQVQQDSTVTPTPSTDPTLAKTSNKIGLNIKGFLGVGDMSLSEEPEHPKNVYRVKYSEGSFPSYNFSVSYQIVKILPTLGLELGASYQYNTIKFKTEEILEDGSYKERSQKIKLHQFGLDTIVTNHFRYIDVYAGITLFPFMNIESLGRSDTPKFAVGVFTGVSYNVYSCINLLFQIAAENSSSVSIKDQNNQDADTSFSLTNVLFGVGTSL